MVPRPVVALAAAVLASVLTGCSLAALPASPSPTVGGGAPTTTRPPIGGGNSTPVTSPTPTPTQPSPPSSGFITRSGTQLLVDGQPYHPVGLDVYELATDWGTNAGCGGMFDDPALASFFSGLPTGSTLRMWAFQGSMATDPATGTIDWTPLDRIVAAAEAHGIYLIVSLANQPGDCDDGHWKDLAWYQGGYRDVHPGSGNADATLSYWDWMQEVVTRYRSSTAIGMWELVNEPEASDCAPGYAESACYDHLSCPNEATATSAMRSFYDTVGAEVHSLDPNHLLESGADGGAQCGWADGGAATIDASPQIDVTSYHDYAPSSVIVPELSDRLGEMQTLDKPLIVGELGIQASATATGCPSLTARATLVSQKITSMLDAGAAGVFLWDRVPNPSSPCAYDIGAEDPVLSLLHGVAG